MNTGTTAQSKLDDYERANSPAGRFMRYARGRLREFWSRQTVTLAGAAILAYGHELWTGLAGLFFILTFELTDLAYLRWLLHRGHAAFEQRRNAAIAIFTGVLQAASVSACIIIAWVYAGQTFHFFSMTFLAGAVLNYGVALYYFPKLGMAKIAVVLTTGFGLLVYDAARDQTVETYLFSDTVGTAMLCYVLLYCVLFINQAQRKNTASTLQNLRSEVALETKRNDVLDQQRKLRQMAKITEALTDPMVIVDDNAKIIWANDKFSQTFATPQQSVSQRRSKA